MYALRSGNSGLPSKVSRSSFTILRIKPRVSVEWRSLLKRPSKRSASSRVRNSWKSSSFPACGVAVISSRCCAWWDNTLPSPKRFVVFTSAFHEV